MPSADPFTRDELLHQRTAMVDAIVTAEERNHALAQETKQHGFATRNSVAGDMVDNVKEIHRLRRQLDKFDAEHQLLGRKERDAAMDQRRRRDASAHRQAANQGRKAFRKSISLGSTS